jgi:inner membrane protein
MCVAGYDKFIADGVFREQLAEKKVNYSNYFTTPSPLNSFLWYNVAKGDSGYYIAYYSVFDKSKELNFTFKPQNILLLDSFPKTEDLQKLLRFSQGYYTIENHNDTLYFSDIRFGQLGGWSNPEANFVFRYILNTGANNDLVIQKGRFEGSVGEGVKSLYHRIAN